MEKTDWYIHFESQYRANERSVESISELLSVYEKLRVAKSPPVEILSSDEKLLSACRQKGKQIEAQQALLTDLQAQLSSKESELRDMTSRWILAAEQAKQLAIQLENTNQILEQKSGEIIKLQEEIRGIETWDDSKNIEACPVHKKINFKISKSLQLESSMDPNVIVATGGTVVVGSRKVFCVKSGALTGTYQLPSLSVMSMDLISDNCLVGTGEGQLCLLELTSGRWLRDLKGHGTTKVKGCGFLGGNTKAFSVATDRTIKVWDLNRGSPIRSVPVVSQIVGGAATIDGTIVATCHQNGGICIWSMSEKICQLDNVHSDSSLGLAISRDGRFLVSLGKDNTLAIIDIHMAQAGPVHRVKGFTALTTDNAPSVSPDSRLVSVCSDIGIQSWDILLASQFEPVHTDALAMTWASVETGNDHSQQIISAHPKGIVKWWTP